MKKIISLSLILLLMISFAAPAYSDGPLKKLGRGIWNLLTFPFEVPNRMTEANKRAGCYESVTYGLWEGLCMACFRAAMGAYEVVTFPVPLPDRYEPILKDPEYLGFKNK